MQACTLKGWDWPAHRAAPCTAYRAGKKQVILIGVKARQNCACHHLQPHIGLESNSVEKVDPLKLPQGMAKHACTPPASKLGKNYEMFKPVVFIVYDFPGGYNII